MNSKCSAAMLLMIVSYITMTGAARHEQNQAVPALMSAEESSSTDAAEPNFMLVSLLEDSPEGSRVLFRGSPYESFDRPLPRVVEANLFTEFESYFNDTQEFSATGPNTYEAEGSTFVAEVDGGCVTGIMGDVYDSLGRMFVESSPEAAPVPLEERGERPCKRFSRLASPIQKYGHMYFHFMQEVLPRILLLRPFLDKGTKLLMFGAPYEFKWLAELGISADQVEVYDPSQQYCADVLLLPSAAPSRSLTPPKENFDLVRSTFSPDDAPEEQRDLIIYCSRDKAGDRQVVNQVAILSSITQHHPSSKLHVFTGSESVPETIALFRRAKVVLGMHGAGLSHVIFSPPGTAVIEFLFMSDPPMMFWHAAAALQQRYLMLPLAQSWWLEQQVEVPVQDVLDALALALELPSSCQEGFELDPSSGECTACRVGTYRPPGSDSCQPCLSGRFAASPASAFCSTCPAGTFSAASSSSCSACPEGTVTALPGAPSADRCIPEADVEAALDGMFDTSLLIKKLVTLPILELQKPKTTLQWVLSALSPQRLFQSWSLPGVQRQYLEDLLLMDQDEEEEEGDQGEGGEAEGLPLDHGSSDSEEGEGEGEGGEQEDQQEEDQQEEDQQEEDQQEEEEETSEPGTGQEEGPAPTRWLRRLKAGYHRVLGSYARSMRSSYRRNLGSSYASTIGGSYRRNLGSSYASTIGGSYRRNLGSSYASTIGGSYRRNLDSSYASTIGGSYRRNLGSSYASTIGGSYRRNLGSSYASTIGGSYRRNLGSSYASTIGGSYRRNLGSSYASTIGGSYRRNLGSSYANTIGGSSRRKLGGANARRGGSN